MQSKPGIPKITENTASACNQVVRLVSSLETPSNDCHCSFKILTIKVSHAGDIKLEFTSVVGTQKHLSRHPSSRRRLTCQINELTTASAYCTLLTFSIVTLLVELRGMRLVIIRDKQ